MAHEELNSSVLKLVPIFYDCVWDIENRAGKFETTSNRQNKSPDSNKRLSEFKEHRFIENTKLLKIFSENCILGRKTS